MKTATIGLTAAMALAIAGAGVASAENSMMSFGGFKLTADAMEVTDDTVIAAGNVEISRDDIVFKGDHATLTKLNGKVLVTLDNPPEPDM